MEPTRGTATLILGLAMMFLISVTVFAEPPVPHDVEEDGVSYEDCVSCHRTGQDGAPLLAADHVQHDNADCRVCHATTGMPDAPNTSHPIAGWEDCRGCHEHWENQEVVEIPNLAESDYDHTITSGTLSTGYESNTCVSCHASATDYSEETPSIACGVCHPNSIEAETIHNGPDNWVDCVDCHQAAATYPHDPELILSRDEDCLSCHYEREGHWTSDRPDEGYRLSDHVARSEPHAQVDCSACHLEIATVERDPITSRVHVSLPQTEEGIPPDNPELASVVKEVDCQRCHASESGVAAPTLELPPRSVLCLACHDASPVIKDNLSWAGVSIFGLGMVVVASIWLQGSIRGRQDLSIPQRIWRIFVGFLDLITTPRLFILIWSFIVDGMLHRKLFRKDKIRWLTHTFMFWGMGARMALGAFTWLMTLAAPTAALTQVLVNKSSPAVALMYDGLGALVILGAAVATVRRYVIKDEQLITSQQDTVAIALIGAIFLMGFVVEGARILTTDLRPDLAAFSFIGYAVSRALSLIPVAWSVVYGWLWYVHAGLVVALIAYLPFSKFIHVLIGPFVAAFNTALEARTT
jgi:nitrate reductase gamma subunit